VKIEVSNSANNENVLQQVSAVADGPARRSVSAESLAVHNDNVALEILMELEPKCIDEI